MMRVIYMAIFILIALPGIAQNVSSRSNEIPLDFRSHTEIQSGSVPRATWKNPVNEISEFAAGPILLKIDLWSKDPLKSAYLFIRDKESRSLKATVALLTPGSGKFSMTVEKEVKLGAGINLLEILVENETGFKCISKREIKVR